MIENDDALLMKNPSALIVCLILPGEDSITRENDNVA